MRFWIAIIVMGLLLVVPLIGDAADASWHGVPLPKDLRIVAPDQDVPKEVAAFSGKWEGW